MRPRICSRFPIAWGTASRSWTVRSADWVGIINEINHEKGKLKVMISIFGKDTPVELDFLQVKQV